MQHNDGLELRKQWNNEPCEHAKLEAEYFEQLPTGDYLCKRCGKVFESWDVHNRNRDEKKDEK